MQFKVNNDFFDGFDVTFTNRESIIDNKHHPLGHFAALALQMDFGILKDIKDLFPVLNHELLTFLCARSVSSAAVARSKLEEMWGLLGKLPAYDLLAPTDRSVALLASHMLERPEKVDEVNTPCTELHSAWNAWLECLRKSPDELRTFCNNTEWMLDEYFEALPAYTSENYAHAYYKFSRTILSAEEEDEEEHYEDGPFWLHKMEVDYPVRIRYVPAQSKNKKAILAERMAFENLASFFYVDLFKGIAAGNIPRRCRNCGKYFLAIGGYGTMYCDRVAPGEQVKTCRMVGAHNREKIKTRSSIVLREYNKAYNRIKQRRYRGKITDEEWNALVARAQDIMDAALRGELSDEEMIALFAEF